MQLSHIVLILRGFIIEKTYAKSIPSPCPPKTYDELEEFAYIIKQGERAAGKSDFDGYIFPADDYEGLTCTALE